MHPPIKPPPGVTPPNLAKSSAFLDKWWMQKTAFPAAYENEGGAPPVVSPYLYDKGPAAAGLSGGGSLGIKPTDDWSTPWPFGENIHSDMLSRNRQRAGDEMKAQMAVGRRMRGEEKSWRTGKTMPASELYGQRPPFRAVAPAKPSPSTGAARPGNKLLAKGAAAAPPAWEMSGMPASHRLSGQPMSHQSNMAPSMLSGPAHAANEAISSGGGLNSIQESLRRTSLVNKSQSLGLNDKLQMALKLISNPGSLGKGMQQWGG
jgi:hypothetical protein